MDQKTGFYSGTSKNDTNLLLSHQNEEEEEKKKTCHNDPGQIGVITHCQVDEANSQRVTQPDSLQRSSSDRAGAAQANSEQEQPPAKALLPNRETSH